MDRKTFRPQKTRKGFVPRTLADPTAKIQNQANQELRNMERVRSAHINNRNDFLRRDQETKKIEEYQHSTNNQLRKQFQDAYHKAEMQHYETAITDARTREIEARRKAANWDKVRDLMPKAVGLIHQNIQAGNAKNIEKGAAILKSSSVESQKYFGDNFGALQEALATGNDLSLNILRSGFPGTSTEWHQLTNLKGYKQFGALGTYVKKFFAEGGANAYFEQQAASDTLVNNKKENYNSVLGNKEYITGSQHRASLGQIRTEFEKLFNQYNSVGNDFYQNIIVPQIDEFFGLKNAEVNTLLIKNREAKAAEIKNIEVAGFIDTFPNDEGKGAGLYFDTEPNKAEALDNIYSYFGDKATKQIPGAHAEWIRFKESERIGPNGKTDKWENLHPQRAQVVDDIWNDNWKKDEANSKRRKESGVQEIVEKVLAHEDKLGRNLNASEWETYDVEIDEVLRTPEDRETFGSPFKAMKSRIPKYERHQRQKLDIELRQNTLTHQKLYAYEPRLRREYAEKLSKLTQKDIDRALRRLNQDIKKMAGQAQVGDDQVSGDTQSIMDKARDKILNNIWDQIGQHDLQSAKVTLYQMVQAEVDLLEAHKGLYARKLENGQPLVDSVGAWANADIEGYGEKQSLALKFESDKSIISQKGILKGAEKKAWLDFAMNQSSTEPYLLRGLDQRDPERTSFQILQDWYKGETGKELVARGTDRVIEEVTKNTSGQTKKLCTDRCSKAKFCTALEAMGTEYTNIAALSQAPPDRVQFNPENTFDVINHNFTGHSLDNASEKIGGPLAMKTNGELINLSQRNIVTNFGAFAFTGKDIQNFINKGLTSETELFSDELQVFLKKQAIDEDTALLFANDSFVDGITGCGQAWWYEPKNKRDDDIDLETAQALSPLLDFTRLLTPISDELITASRTNRA